MTDCVFYYCSANLSEHCYCLACSSLHANLHHHKQIIFQMQKLESANVYYKHQVCSHLFGWTEKKTHTDNLFLPIVGEDVLCCVQEVRMNMST